MGLKRITFNGYKHQFNGFIVSVGYENLTDLLYPLEHQFNGFIG